jgi:hypothetical protein
MWVALSNERTDLSFTVAAGHRQRSHSRVRVPRDAWPYFTLSDSRLPQPGGPGPRIYRPQEQGNPFIPSGTGFPFRRLIRLTGLRCRYISSECYINVLFVLHRKYIKSPLQRLTGRRCLGKESLFIVRTIWNTQIHPVGRMQSFSVLKQVVLIVTAGI